VKRLLLSLAVVLCSVGFVASDVEAKRLGGGSSSGMKRQTPPPQSPTPAQNATPNQAAPTNAAAPTAAAGAQAAAPKRSWMGPIAGLAAGLGIAALLSHFGMGEGLANVMTMLLIAAAAFFVIRFLLRRFGPGAAKAAAAGGPNGMRLATAGGAPMSRAAEPGWSSGPGATPGHGLAGASAGLGGAAGLGAASGAAAVGHIPAGFDTAGFERIAKLIFIRMQAANDAGDLNDLRQFATPEMFATFKLDLQERGAAKQQTDVVQLEAEVVDVESTAEQQVVSVRFHGLIREEQDTGATRFDEVWHLVKPADGSREWAIAGIAQNDLV
jgi:predicted lipid-binding transport protein (Tim44 family)